MFKKIFFSIYLISGSLIYADSDFTKQFDTDGDLWLRIKYSYSDYKIALIGKSNNKELSDYKYAFSSNILSYGSLNNEGIIREINNAFGYDINSSVFYESNDFEADISLSGLSKKTLSLKPSRYCGVFYIKHEDYENYGIYLDYINLWRLYFTTSFIYTEIFNQRSSDSWYYDFKNYKKGLLVHSANKLEYRGKFFKLASAITLSSGEYQKEALLGRLHTEIDLKYFIISYLKIYKEDDYICPDGSYEKYYDLDSVYLKLFPEKKYNIEYKVRERLGTGLNPWDNDNYNLEQIYCLNYEDKLFNMSFDYFSKTEQEETYNNLSIKYSRYFNRCSLSLLYKKDNEENIDIYKISPRFNGKYLNLYFNIYYYESEEDAFSFTSGADLDFDKINFYLRLKSKRDIDLEEAENSFDDFDYNYLLTTGVKLYF